MVSDDYHKKAQYETPSIFGYLHFRAKVCFQKLIFNFLLTQSHGPKD